LSVSYSSIGSDDWDQQREEYVKTNAACDERGCFDLNDLVRGATLELVVLAPGYTRAVTQWVFPLDTTAEIRMEKGGRSLYGRVRNGEGKGIEGVGIHVTLPGPPLTTQTDGKGRFRVESLPRNIDSVDISLSHSDFLSIRDVKRLLSAGKSTEVDFSMQLRPRVICHTRDMNTRLPVAGVELRMGFSPMQRTDANGEHDFGRLDLGNVGIRAETDEYVPEVRELALEPGRDYDVIFELDPGVALSGTVTTPGGRGVCGASVSRRQQDRRAYWRTKTDAEGRFQLAHIPAGTGEISVWKERFIRANAKYDSHLEEPRIVLHPQPEHKLTVGKSVPDADLRGMQVGIRYHSEQREHPNPFNEDLADCRVESGSRTFFVRPRVSFGVLECVFTDKQGREATARVPTDAQDPLNLEISFVVVQNR